MSPSPIELSAKNARMVFWGIPYSEREDGVHRYFNPDMTKCYTDSDILTYIWKFKSRYISQMTDISNDSQICMKPNLSVKMFQLEVSVIAFKYIDI